MGLNLRGGLAGFGKGIADMGQTGFESEIMRMRSENLARFQAGLAEEGAVREHGRDIERLDYQSSLVEKKEGREDYAVGEGGILSRAAYNALPPEEKANYTSLTQARVDNENRKTVAAEKKADDAAMAAERRADAADRAAVAAEKKADAAERLADARAEAAMKHAEAATLRAEKVDQEKDLGPAILSHKELGDDIIQRGRAGEDVSGEITWYNTRAEKIGAPTISFTKGEKGFFWDDKDTYRFGEPILSAPAGAARGTPENGGQTRLDELAARAGVNLSAPTPAKTKKPDPDADKPLQSEADFRQAAQMPARPSVGPRTRSVPEPDPRYAGDRAKSKGGNEVEDPASALIKAAKAAVSHVSDKMDQRSKSMIQGIIAKQEAGKPLSIWEKEVLAKFVNETGATGR